MENEIILNDKLEELKDLIYIDETPFHHLDFVKVPCTPCCILPGMSFLSARAMEEYKNGYRTDEINETDEILIEYFYAKRLHKNNLVKIKFPEYYEMAGALLSDATAACVGSLTYLYFELGNELCEMLPENEWPVEKLKELLLFAEIRRRTHLIKHSDQVDQTYLEGMTLMERKMFNSFFKGSDMDKDNAKSNRKIFNFFEYDL
ncbi:conserved Plasmodium protein, unknown function [Plasmodium berghei]|uniref:GINS subunit domain-containing protein n=2 Tax=Plasmodium berghei TaxID=5821 RepID=A0A509AR82_PLABA|nr:conserved protein, unknown function [Plasmodium berghei ANKA]CXJ10126.1 conserved Plasmodium protein, unknown function [Plasmodium berghei]SCM25935.1 conserved Plasmodium protein, unknown function [Plasmodium berghei]SCN28190.1 conserved Plasmodium protein, unknown function [Plasmodium berghei]SCO62392.1 conserved Plasmodium protein, unknown function [Plasmodium berghei]SCO63950.1 conserved Plasmodium protein, unknown function [Plasmodium berghei]|eukprot:XP_034423846.1 conserved protein, unknown function [Plasmodium berghei ANKA]